MYAVVYVKGFQFRVATGDEIAVQKMDGSPGSEVILDDVLMVGDGEKSVIGAPSVANAVVKATILEQGKGKKVIVFKKKRRKGYKVKKGHRQELTWLRIDDISVKSGSAKKAEKPAKKVVAEVE